MMPIRIVGKYVWSVWKLWRGVWNYSTLPATVSTHPTHNSPLVQLVLLFATIYFSTTYHILCISGTRFEL